MTNKVNKGETWEGQIESAYVDIVNALYDMFMALNMDKDYSSHINIDTKTWDKLDKMLKDHVEFVSVWFSQSM